MVDLVHRGVSRNSLPQGRFGSSCDFFNALSKHFRYREVTVLGA